MKISRKVYNKLGRLIAGDILETPRMSGPQLVEFFNEVGFDDVYGAGFPSRWAYAAEKVEQANDSSLLKKIFEEFVEPRRFPGNEQSLEACVNAINDIIKYDGYSLFKIGNVYKIADIQGNFIQAETSKAIGHEFISEQIKKCNDKIVAGDFNGAITNARTLLEAVLIHIVESVENQEIKNDGDLLSLWTKAKKALKIEIKKEEYPDFIFQILSGISTSINGLAGLSNNAGDRHANKFKTKKHHAKLAVNQAMTCADFLVDVLNEKQRK